MSRIAAAESIDDVFAGTCDAEAFQRLSPAWPGGRWARIDAGPVVRAPHRTVEEYVFHPAAEEDPVLPLAVVWDAAGQARLYYSPRLFGESILRPASTAPATEDEVGGALAQYFAALATGDPDGLHQTVTDSYVFRDPSGG